MTTSRAVSTSTIAAAVPAVECPKCHADEGQPCRVWDKASEKFQNLNAHHVERYEAAEASEAAKLPGAVRISETFTYVPNVSTGDTMADLIAERLAKVETARREKWNKAKTNLERLMIQGVVITCDDEMDNYYIGKYRSEQAKLAGVSVDLYTRAAEFAQEAEGILLTARTTAENYETREEHWARVEEAAAKAAHPVAKGMKKPCRHNATKTSHGLIESTPAQERMAGKERWRCCRCGTEFTIFEKPALPTAAAQAAAHLVKAFGRPEVK